MELLTPEDLRSYQKDSTVHQLIYPHTMMWLQPGLGKTIITLTSIVDRMRAGQVTKTLVFGPLRVVHAVWAREARKWSHTRHLRFSIMKGGPEERARALFADADIYLCNYENMNWLAKTLDHYYLSQNRPLPFQFVVYDEISMLKNSTSKRMGGGKRIVKDNWGKEYEIKLTPWRKFVKLFPFTTGLTGTPASNGYLDLHGQYLAVDGGQRLGEFITHYKDSYFASDYNGWTYTPTEQGKAWIEHKISDITKRLDADGYVDLPDCQTVNMMVDLPGRARSHYDELEKDLFTQLDNGTEVELFNKASLSNKCLQICNGSIYYGEDSSYETIHDVKLKALEEVLEQAQGQPVLCAYSFKPDAERIMKKFKKYRPINLSGEDAAKTAGIIDKWNQGGIKLLIGHPKSMGHGIDGLQDSGSILVWFGINWSWELYDQTNRRLNRSGQKNPVSIIRILCNDTLDLAVADAIDRKKGDEEGLKNAVDRYRRGITTNDLEVNFY